MVLNKLITSGVLQRPSEVGVGVDALVDLRLIGLR